MTSSEYELFHRICETFFRLGVPTHMSGFRYLVSAVTLVYYDPDYLRSITGRLYPAVAEECGTDPRCVEHSIRTAIEATFLNSSSGYAYSYFGDAVDPDKGKVINSDFIATVAFRLRSELPLKTAGEE